MNEANTVNDGAFVEPVKSVESPQTESASCPFYSVLPNENIVARNLPLLAPAEDTELETEIPTEKAPQQDWVAEPDKKKQEAIDAEFKKLLALNEELRADNDELYNQVQKLTSELSESEKALQWQKKRSSVTESMLKQQTQELGVATEQVQSLVQQLETAVQTVQRQESLIENYREQLEFSQQRLAQLERECTLLQSNYNEQSHQLLQSENTCRELRTRLMRQQRQTMQFKAALEKCLETPIPGYNNPDNENIGDRKTSPLKEGSSLYINAQPIRPWSAEPESYTDNIVNLWGECSLTEDSSTLSQSSTEDTSNEKSLPTPPQSDPQPEIDDYSITPESASPSELKNLEEQLDEVIQMFFVSKPASIAPQTPPQSEDVNSETREAVWETVATPLVDEESQTPTPPLLEENPENPLEEYSPESSQSVQEDLLKVSSPQESFNDDYANPNSPSPVVYPQRPPKGRKSLASVELPNFRRKIE
jgi:myosin heavy subunit